MVPDCLLVQENLLDFFYHSVLVLELGKKHGHASLKLVYVVLEFDDVKLLFVLPGCSLDHAKLFGSILFLALATGVVFDGLPGAELVSVLLLCKLILAIFLDNHKPSDEFGCKNLSVDEGDHDETDNDALADTSDLGQQVQPRHLDDLIDLDLVVLLVLHALAGSDCPDLKGPEVLG